MESSASLEILHNITKLVVEELSPEKLLPLIARELRPLVNFDRVSITIYNKETDSFEFRAIALDDHSNPFFKGSFPRNGSRAGKCIAEGRTIYFPDLLEKKEFFETNFLIDEGYRSGLCIPLVMGQRSFGTLNFNARKTDPFSPDQICFLQMVSEPVAIAMRNALAFEEINRIKNQLMMENRYLMQESKGGFTLPTVIGHSQAFRRALAQIDKVSPTNATVLLLGETGTGKELAAKLIHEKSHRANKRFVKVNCSAVPDTLLESELFGYVRGAFTGANKDKVGRFEFADGGTLFLDEISELSFELQAKLLRVLQDREITRIGSNLPKPVDFRAIAATNCNLKNEVKAGRFRKDLFFRLNVFPIELPPLRARNGDLVELVDHIINRFSVSLGKSFLGITRESMDLLRSYSWPGNIRELENVIERACILTSNGSTIDISSSMLAFQGEEFEKEFKPLEQVEREHIIRVLSFTNGRIEGEAGAAAILRVNPNTLRSRLKKLGITIRRFAQTEGGTPLRQDKTTEPLRDLYGFTR